MTSPYSIEKLPGEPIILTSVTSAFSAHNGLVELLAEARRELDNATTPLYNVVDLTQSTMGLDDVILASNSVARGEESVWHHPKVKQMVIVSKTALIKLAAAGLNSAVFGRLNVKVFGTCDEALAFCRT